MTRVKEFIRYILSKASVKQIKDWLAHFQR